MQLYAVNFIPLLGLLHMFRALYTPIIRNIYFYNTGDWNDQNKITADITVQSS